MSGRANSPVTLEGALVAALLFAAVYGILDFSAHSAAGTPAAARLVNRSGSGLLHA